MENKYRQGHKHPTKDRIFWAYSHKEGNPKRKELWLKPDAFERKRIKQSQFQKSEVGKEKSKRDYQRKKAYISQRDKDRKEKYKIHNPFRLMINVLKLGAKRRGIEFIISYEDLEMLWEKQDGKCYYTQIPMNFTYSLSLPKQMSVDRVDSSKGYTLDNVVLCCQFINFAKHDYKLEDFLEFLKELRK